MSYSIVAFLWRKPGLTPDEFRHHYETIHIPLLLTLLAFPKSYTRFYLPRQLSTTYLADTSNTNYAPTIFLNSTDDFDYDAFASIVFADEAAFDMFYTRLRDPDIAKVLGDDEDKFLWRQKLVVAAAGAPCVTLHSEAA
ncbi:hypothetical protein ABVK25_011879 [Lepraria finkii]|uniref:EthD domain-containing protein n=1 Tax=Lepraria finkii TaxID=1340010 RepID=A0ABR4ALA9_9LECA